MMRTALVAASLCLAVSAWGQSARHLAQARQEIVGLRYDRAAGSLEQALRAGDAGPDAVAEIHLLAGRVAAALGRSAEAEEHFCRLLALHPGDRLPEGVSPKLARPFAAAQETMRRRGPLRVRHEATGGDTPMLVVTIASDPLRMVAGARLRLRTSGGPEQTLEAKGHGRIVLPLPHAPRIELSGAVLDGHGNRLVEFGPVEVTGHPEPPSPAGPTAAPTSTEASPGPAAHRRSFVASPWLWGGAAAAFAATGMGFGLAAHAKQSDLNSLNKQSPDHSYAEAHRLQERGELYALLTNISFAVAGACAVAAIVLLVRDLRGRAERRRAEAAPAPGGAALRLRF
jgi:hypothetical protein